MYMFVEEEKTCVKKHFTNCFLNGCLVFMLFKNLIWYVYSGEPPEKKPKSNGAAEQPQLQYQQPTSQPPPQQPAAAPIQPDYSAYWAHYQQVSDICIQLFPLFIIWTCTFAWVLSLLGRYFHYF